MFLYKSATTLFLFISVFYYSQSVWKTFNFRNQFSLSLPVPFSVNRSDSDELLIHFGNNKDITTAVFLDYCNSSKELEANFKDQVETSYSGYYTITYKIIKPMFYVISGTMPSKYDFYLKAFYKNGVIYTLFIQYPKHKKKMTGFVSKISASFK